MARVVLTRAMTYLHDSRDRPGTTLQFRRGVPTEVGEQDYIFLMGRGFNDPDLNFVLVDLARVVHLPPASPIGIARMGGMGDVLMASIAVRELMMMRPDLQACFLTQETYQPFLRDMDFLAYKGAMHRLSVQVHDADWRRSLRDNTLLLANLQGVSETREGAGTPRIDLYTERLTGRKPTSYRYPLHGRQEEVERGLDIVQSDGRMVLGIALHANVRERTWPLRYSIQLAELAALAGWLPVFLSARQVPSTPEMDELGIVNLTSRSSIQDLMCVVQACDVVVGPDTGIIHLAEALETRAVAYFTSVEPDARLRHYRYTRSLWSALPCSPCYHTPCPAAYMTEGAPCCLSILPEHVWEEVQFVAENDPPWPLEAEFMPAAIQWPNRPPEKPRDQVVRHLAVESRLEVLR